jgi:hypothetical protein
VTGEQEIGNKGIAYKKFLEVNEHMNDLNIIEYALFQEQYYDLRKLGALEERNKLLMDFYAKDKNNTKLAYEIYQNAYERQVVVDDLKFTQRILEEKFGRKGIYNDVPLNDPLAQDKANSNGGRISCS